MDESLPVGRVHQADHLARPKVAMSDINRTIDNNSLLFPDCGFWNMHHLGIADKKRFNAKQKFLKEILLTSVLVGLSEVHASPARAQSLFFAVSTLHFTIVRKTHLANASCFVKHG